ncbi:iron-containing alcohol dehydrogenase [Eubacterium pyruvativorans]|uniref:iron-containing alcohol dehydrogenase n=1 Tax=Eubacterium pyruvativorans TaxID=155865 RepID=UPI0008829906|nr:iron-containing alcohol dehydrogenase [Eubacterium pyruvativorans]SDE95082.1 alcohol dehydrogenase [Eubacterium pyruvativorans]
MTKDFRWFDPTELVFGPGKLNTLHTLEMPGKKALLVISDGKSARANGSLDRTEEQLRMAGVEVVLFDRVGPNPEKPVVEAGARLARAQGCDMVVALGGGSVMDAAKVMAAFAVMPGDDLWDYAPGATGRRKPLDIPSLPTIMITTSAGTGSEVDSWGVITNPKTREKVGIGRVRHMFPVYAIVDPELMVTVPPKFTAYQGFDALFHNMEGYISNAANFMGDMIQESAIEKIGAYLERAVKDGSDLEARANVAYANTMGGYSMIITGTTSEHGMEHAMSAYHTALPHGAGLIMISLEYFRYFIQKHVCDERFVRMARALGRRDAEKPEELLDALADLQRACGVDDLKMSDYGITPEELPKFVQNAKTVMAPQFTKDRYPMTDEDCEEIYRRSFR